MSNLQDRAEAIHLSAGMPWHEANRLALSEIGVDDAAIEELTGECAHRGDFLTGDEIPDFVRAVLVHGSALMVTAPASARSDLHDLLRMAHKVRDWMGDGCNADDMPKAQIAALTEWAGSTATAMLATPPTRTDGATGDSHE